jgi:hypothetical protein
MFVNWCVAFLIVIILIGATGCVATQREAGNSLKPAVSQPVPTPILEQSTVPVIALHTVAPTMILTTIVTPLPLIKPEKTPAQISESALKARIQDAKNKLDMFKESSMADTTIKQATPPLYCEIKESKELGYLIDVNTGEMSFVKGEYGSISLDLFRQDMTQGHTYIILHSHAKNWFTCKGTGTISLNTFSLADLAAAANLTGQGYHIQKVIAVGDQIYEVYPKIRDNWKTTEEVYNGVDRIEKRTDLKYHIDYYDPDTGEKTIYFDVDNLMPLLTRELDYTYTVNNVALT